MAGSDEQQRIAREQIRQSRASDIAFGQQFTSLQESQNIFIEQFRLREQLRQAIATGATEDEQRIQSILDAREIEAEFEQEQEEVELERIGQEQLEQDVEELKEFGVPVARADPRAVRREVQRIQNLEQLIAGAEDIKEGDISPPISDVAIREPERKDPADREQKMQSQIEELFIQLAGVEPLNQPSFNVDRIVKFFEDNTTTGDQFLDVKGSIQQFIKSLDSVFRQAFASPDPLNNVRSVFATLGIAANEITRIFGSSPDDIIERLIGNTDPILNLKRLQQVALQPVDIGFIIDNVFGTDLKKLKNRDISPRELGAIRAEFQDDLVRFEGAVSSGSIQSSIALGKHGFDTLIQYIDKNVSNPQLRTLLLADIQHAIARDEQKLGIQLGTAPPNITPISMNQFQILRPNIRESLENLIGLSLAQHNRMLENIERLLIEPLVDIDTGEQIRVVRENERLLRQDVLSTVETVNDFIRKNQISNEDGTSAIIPTEQIIDFDGTVPSTTLPITNNILITQMTNLAQRLRDATQTFLYFPSKINPVSVGRLQTREMIVRDFVNMQRRISIRIMSRPGLQTTLPHAELKRATFPGVSILRGKRRDQMFEGKPTGTMGAQMREIQINSGITIFELAKLANMIAMESGTLETIQQIPLLNVQKGVTTIQDIVAAIMLEQKSHSGNSFSLIYVPSHPMGGLFIDGSLDVINKSRMLSNPVGGDFFSSAFKSIGNVVKGIASIPIQLASIPAQIAGSIFGGTLQPFVKKNYNPALPIARRASAPQTGGILPHDTFTQGEHQPEPYASRNSDNVFRILPFPFGGRIRNSGYVSKDEHNPLFDLGNIPVIRLTSFG